MSDSPFSIDVSGAQFETAVLETSRRVPVLVDFWAAWCGPCRTLKPLLEKLAADYNGGFILAKVDTEEEQTLAANFSIRSLPTVKLFKDGMEVDQFMGALPEASIRELLDRYIQAPPKASDELRARAQAALEANDPDSALSLLKQAAEDDPDNPAIAIELALLLMEMGDFDAARGSLDKVPMDIRDQPEYKAVAARLAFSHSPKVAPDELLRKLERDPNDSDSRLQLVDALVQNGEYTKAMEHLLTMVGRDDGSARERMLAVFDLLDDPALVKTYRSRLFNALH